MKLEINDKFPNLVRRSLTQEQIELIKKHVKGELHCSNAEIIRIADIHPSTYYRHKQKILKNLAVPLSISKDSLTMHNNNAEIDALQLEIKKLTERLQEAQKENKRLTIEMMKLNTGSKAGFLEEKVEKLEGQLNEYEELLEKCKVSLKSCLNDNKALRDNLNKVNTKNQELYNKAKYADFVVNKYLKDLMPWLGHSIYGKEGYIYSDFKQYILNQDFSSMDKIKKFIGSTSDSIENEHIHAMTVDVLSYLLKRLGYI